MNKYMEPSLIYSDLGVKIIYRFGPNDTLEIVDIYSQIRSVGNGTKVYGEFEKDIIKKFKIKAIYAFVRRENTRAKIWYERQGFKIVDIPNLYWDSEASIGIKRTL